MLERQVGTGSRWVCRWDQCLRYPLVVINMISEEGRLTDSIGLMNN